MTNLAPAAGWYPDPQDPRQQRWFDGTQWTQHLQPSPGAGPVYPVSTMGMAQPHPTTSNLAIAALGFAFALPFVGFVLGIVSLVSIKKSATSAQPKSGNGFAIAALVVSVVWGLLLTSVLMAVAIPTFLAQKSTATSVQAKANIKESCAVGNLDGSYTGCLAGARLDPGLQAALRKGCAVPGGVCITPIGTQGYEVRAMATGSGGKVVTFTRTAGEDGRVRNSCSPKDARTCPAGTW
jgi:hypothetical protein